MKTREENGFRQQNKIQYNGDQDNQTWGRSNNEAYVWQDDGHQEHHEGHRGKGPKGYKRTDTRIQDDIHDRLTYDNFLDASNIEVTVMDGEVVLSGTVSERQDKRRAEDISESVSGVLNVENQIRVKRTEDTDKKTDSPESQHHYKSLIRSHSHKTGVL